MTAFRPALSVMTAPGRRRAMLAAGLGLAAAVALAACQGGGLSPPFAMRQAYIDTPQCSEHPDAPWIGRLAGHAMSDNSRQRGSGGGTATALVGCFPTQEACEAWRWKYMANFVSTLVQNSCEPRAPRGSSLFAE